MEAKTSKQRTGRLGEWLGKLALLGFGLGIGLLGAELAVRIVRPQAVLIIPDAMYEHETGKIDLRPGFEGRITNRVEFDHGVALNSLGLRGPELDADADRLRILAIGDSFNFGLGVEREESFPALLADRITAAGTPAVAVSAGVPGFGVGEAVARFERVVERVDPDLVLLSVFVGNDLQDDANVEMTVRRGLVRHGVNTRSAGLMEWLFYHSHLYVLVKTAVPTGPYEKLRAALGMSESGRKRRLVRLAQVYRREPTELVARGRAAMDEALGELTALAGARGVPVAAMIIPDLAQLDEAAWRRSLEQLDLDPADYDRLAPTRIIRALLDRHGIPTLDLTDDMAAAEAAGERAYFPLDRHWTPRGHALAAARLYAFLRTRGLLPDAGSRSAERAAR